MQNKKEKNNRKKRRLLLSLLMMLLTVVVLSTGTYAWFTENKTVTVSDITVNVAASNGLQISVDGINFKTLISNADITGVQATTYTSAVNQLPQDTASLVPVSTIGELSKNGEGAYTGFINMYKGSIDSNGAGQNILVSSKSTETNSTTSGDFVAFDLFLQVTDTTQIYLTANSKIGTAAETTATGIQNAARVAFVYEGYAATGSDATTIQGLKADGNTYAYTDAENAEQNPNRVMIWEPNYDVHTAAGVINATTVYGEAVYGAGKTVATTDADQLEYYGVKSDILKGDNVLLASTNATNFSKVTPLISTPFAGIESTAYRALMFLNPGINKVRVYMWIEGQDVDCENNASGGSVTYSLQFSTLSQA